MLEDWITYKLGEISKNVSRRFDFSKHQNVVFINTSDVLEGKFLHSTIIDSKGLPGQAKKAIQKGDILFSEIRPKNKRYAFVEFDAANYVVSTKFMVIDSDNTLVDKKFFMQLLTSNERLDELQSIAEGRSGTFPQITFDAIKDVEFYLPPLQEQRAIASILSALDDKIELNLQMNKTLEDMAMALYKHWFVDFGPFQNGEFVDSELGMIPKGWEVKPIGDVIETLGGGTPKTMMNEYWENGTLDWYSPTDLTKADSLYSMGSAKKITPLGLQKSSAKLFPSECLLMSSRATIGAITINMKEACTNQGFITMVPNNILSVYQLHGWTVTNMDLIVSKANGSTFKEISKSNFRNLPIIIGSNIDSYSIQSKSIYEQIKNNIIENETLTTLRDTLLPKLISGEVRVKDIEQTIAQML